MQDLIKNSKWLNIKESNADDEKWDEKIYNVIWQKDLILI